MMMMFLVVTRRTRTFNVAWYHSKVYDCASVRYMRAPAAYVGDMHCHSLLHANVGHALD